MTIFNGTPHDINIIDNATFDSSLRKFVTDSPNVVATIPSNGILSAKVETTQVEPINGGIPTFSKRTTGYDPIPDGYDIVIVSALYATAVRSHDASAKLYTVADPVYSTDGKTIHGCRGICN